MEIVVGIPTDTQSIVVFLMAFIVFIVFARLLYQEPAGERCQKCNEHVGYDYCLDCRGTNVKDITRGGLVVKEQCLHHFGFVSRVICYNCR